MKNVTSRPERHESRPAEAVFDKAQRTSTIRETYLQGLGML